MNRALKIILVFVALLLAGGALFWAGSISKAGPGGDPTEKPPAFSGNHYARMLPDSFVMLAHKAYDPFLTAVNTGKEIRLNMANANALTRDFFNGNDSLLSFKKRQHGFSISYNATHPAVEAIFEIQPDGAIHVPNDVLLPMLARYQALAPAPVKGKDSTIAKPQKSKKKK